MNKRMLEFTGKVMSVGKNACLLKVDGVTGWVPDNEADYIDEPVEKEEIKLLIPEWLAIKKGFI